MEEPTTTNTEPAEAGEEEVPSKPVRDLGGVEITLYWLEKSRSHRILWLLHALNLPHKIQIFHRDKKTMRAPPELKEIHPLGKSPVISVSAPWLEKPVMIAESANIVEYLIDNFGEGYGLVPERWQKGLEGKVGGETEGWRRWRYFLHYAEGTFMSLMLVALIVINIKSAPVSFFIRPITNGIASKLGSSYVEPNTKSNLDFLESQLATSPSSPSSPETPGAYLCGPTLSAADILMSYGLQAARGRVGFTQELYPLLWAYVDRLEKEEGYLEAVEEITRLEGVFKAVL